MYLTNTVSTLSLSNDICTLYLNWEVGREEKEGKESKQAQGIPIRMGRGNDGLGRPCVINASEALLLLRGGAGLQLVTVGWGWG